MEQLRTVEKRLNDTWFRCDMKDMRTGDVFRMFNPGESERVEDSDFIATSDAVLGINPKFSDAWGVEAEPYKKEFQISVDK